MRNYFFAIVFLYLLTRIVSIFIFPIFNDEVFYVRWVQEIQDGYLMRPLDNGRQPLFLWISTLLNYFIKNELLSLRFVSLLAGLLSLCGIYFLSQKLFKNWRVSLGASFIYVVFPLTLIHDSIGILDSSIVAVSIWSLIYGIKLFKNPRIINAVILGLILGSGLLIKSNALLSLVLLPMIFVLKPNLVTYKNRKRLIKILVLFFLSVLISKLIELIIVLQPNYFRVLAANGIFIYPLKEWIFLSFAFKLSTFFSNAEKLMSWILEYFLTLILPLVFLPFAFSNFKKEKILLFLYFLVPYILLSSFGRVMFPRYILPMIIFLIPLISQLVYEIYLKLKDRRITTGLCLIIFILPIYSSISLMTGFEKSFIPAIDKAQYFKNSDVIIWMKEELAKIKRESGQEEVVIFLDDDSLVYKSLIEFVFYKSNNFYLTHDRNKFFKSLTLGNNYIVSTRKNFQYNQISRFEKNEIPVFIYNVEKNN